MRKTCSVLIRQSQEKNHLVDLGMDGNTRLYCVVDEHGGNLRIGFSCLSEHFSTVSCSISIVSLLSELQQSELFKIWDSSL